jgi:hypothetical protein
MYAKVSVFLVIKEVYITTTMTFHLTHERMAIIMKTNNKNSLKECDEKEPTYTVRM